MPHHNIGFLPKGRHKGRLRMGGKGNVPLQGLYAQQMAGLHFQAVVFLGDEQQHHIPCRIQLVRFDLQCAHPAPGGCVPAGENCIADHLGMVKVPRAPAVVDQLIVHVHFLMQRVAEAQGILPGQHHILIKTEAADHPFIRRRSSIVHKKGKVAFHGVHMGCGCGVITIQVIPHFRHCHRAVRVHVRGGPG